MGSINNIGGHISHEAPVQDVCKPLSTVNLYHYSWYEACVSLVE